MRFIFTATAEADSAADAWTKITANKPSGAWHHMFAIESEVTPASLRFWAEATHDEMRQKLFGEAA